MTQHSKQDETDGASAFQRITGASFARKPPTSANDNDCNAPLPLIPFPAGADSLLREQQEVIDLFPAQPGRATLPTSSWKAMLGWFTYVLVVSIAMVGWLYVLWLAVQGLFS
jgi:hypothetical protein